jgi:bud site selection protein 31
LKNKRVPEGFEMIEDVIDDFEQQMRDAVNESHEGKRKNETTWKIHRLHWEKNRFIYDLMYVRKVISRELYDFLVREKIADGALISKWRKPGYEILCSMLAIQKGNHNFGTTSHCRVPMKNRAPQQRVTPDVQTGCICCASGDGRFGGPIWWNTPMDDSKEAREANRAVWVQEGEEEEEEEEDREDVEGTKNASNKKRPFEEIQSAVDDEDDLDPEVKKRLEALKSAK